MHQNGYTCHQSQLLIRCMETVLEKCDVKKNVKKKFSTSHIPDKLNQKTSVLLNLVMRNVRFVSNSKYISKNFTKPVSMMKTILTELKKKKKS